MRRSAGEMTDDSNHLDRRVVGHVKWFDPTKGFGFVVADAGGPDILLHANVLRNFGQSSVADSAGIEIIVQDTERGTQATEIVRIDPPATDSVVLEDIDNAPEIGSESGPLLPARVKWFDKGKGFGFANVFGSSDDVFVHIEVLRRSGLAELQPGEAIAIRLRDGKRGMMATIVTGWDLAVGQVE